METVVRHWVLLQHIPTYPRKIDVGRLHELINNFDPELEVTRRTIERDLLKLSLVFRLISDGHRPQGWSLSKDEKLNLPPLHKNSYLKAA
jgi:hypothetical protein